MDACKLQDAGLDTFAANDALFLPPDTRDFACGASVLRAKGVDKIRLITNNPDKLAQLTRNRIEVVECVATGTFQTLHNARYLKAKVDCAGHRLRL